MKYSFTAASLLALASAATHQVQVGPNLSFSPDTVAAATGDVVAFTFGAGHDVVSGPFGSPCQNDGKIYSGAMPSEGQVFSVTINSTDPIWIYCAVPTHCQSGMAMVINAPFGKTIADYKSAASSSGSSNAPGSVTGGSFDGASSSDSSSSSASNSSSTAAAASSASMAASSASTSATAAMSSAASSASAAASASGTGAASNVVANLGMVAGAVAGGMALLV